MYSDLSIRGIYNCHFLIIINFLSFFIVRFLYYSSFTHLSIYCVYHVYEGPLITLPALLHTDRKWQEEGMLYFLQIISFACLLFLHICQCLIPSYTSFSLFLHASTFLRIALNVHLWQGKKKKKEKKE